MTKDKKIELMTHLTAALIQARPNDFIDDNGVPIRFKEEGIWFCPLVEAAFDILYRIEEMAESDIEDSQPDPNPSQSRHDPF